MADYLQREFNLPVIRIATTQRKSGALVSVTAVLNRNGQRTEVGSVEVPLARFGYRSRGVSELAVPREVIEMLAGGGDGHGTWPRANSEWEAWLHLVKPYGTLGAVPWERDLAPALGRPIARLPDVLSVSRAPQERFHVAILAAAPRVGPMTIAHIAETLVSGVGHSIMLTVACARKDRQGISSALAKTGLEHEVVTLAEGRSAGSVLDRAAEALAGRPVDAVHFIMRAVPVGNQGVLVPDKTSGLSALTTSDVSMFLTKMGAAVAAFTRPPGRWSDFGLRLMVDELGSTRAGPVLLHDPRVDREGVALAGAYAVLAAPATDRLRPSPGLTIFLQPAMLETDPYSAQRVTDNTWLGDDGVASTPPRSSVLRSSNATAEPASPPQWVAAAQQFFDQQQTELARFERASAVGEVTEVERARYEGVQRALADSKAILEQFSGGQL